MKKKVLQSCGMILALGFAVTVTNAWAEDSPEIEGRWIARALRTDALPRSWRHTTGNNYSATFQFFGLIPGRRP